MQEGFAVVRQCALNKTIHHTVFITLMCYMLGYKNTSEYLTAACCDVSNESGDENGEKYQQKK